MVTANFHWCIGGEQPLENIHFLHLDFSHQNIRWGLGPWASNQVGRGNNNAHFCPELSEKPGESCLLLVLMVPACRDRGWGVCVCGERLAVSGALGMWGDLQEQWVPFWGADSRQWGYMWWKSWNQRGKVGPPGPVPQLLLLSIRLPKPLQWETPKHLSWWVCVYFGDL